MPAELMDSEVLLSSDIFIMLKRCRDLVQPRNSCVNLLIMSLMLPFLTFIQGTFIQSNVLAFTVITITV